MKQVKAKIISNERVARGRFKMRLEAPSISRLARPGQFVMIKCSETLDPILRRPLSFHKIEKRHFELLYQVIGKGTKALSERKKGERLDIIGPLGNGFKEANGSKVRRLLIAGGIGVAPLYALAEKLSAFGSQLSVLIGAKTKNHILCANEFKKLGFSVEIATEDGSKGHKGLVTDLLRHNLRITHYALRITVYACGPREMLKEIARIAKSKKILCQISFEERMACGTGVCLGCAVKTVSGYKMACKDGPVFNAGEIIW